MSKHQLNQKLELQKFQSTEKKNNEKTNIRDSRNDVAVLRHRRRTSKQQWYQKLYVELADLMKNAQFYMKKCRIFFPLRTRSKNAYKLTLNEKNFSEIWRPTSATNQTKKMSERSEKKKSTSFRSETSRF